MLGKHETTLPWVLNWDNHCEPNRAHVSQLPDSAEVVSQSLIGAGNSTVALWAAQTPGHTRRKMKGALPGAKPSSARGQVQVGLAQ